MLIEAAGARSSKRRSERLFGGAGCVCMQAGVGFQAWTLTSLERLTCRDVLTRAHGRCVPHLTAGVSAYVVFVYTWALHSQRTARRKGGL